MKNKKQVLYLVTTASLLAITIILQACASLIVMPVTQTSPALAFIPIVVGAILLGRRNGAFLGFAWSVFILVSGQASYYMGLNAWGTVLLVILKGTLAGYLAGLAYQGLKKKNAVVAMIVAALVAPLVNSLIYRLGLVTIFRDIFLAGADKKNMDAFQYFFVAFISVSFLVEVGISAVFSPAIVAVCNIGKKVLHLEEDKVEEDSTIEVVSNGEGEPSTDRSEI